MDEDVEVWDDDEDEGSGTSAFDMENFRIRLMAQRCDTCIFRPGNLMHLMPGRLKSMVEDSAAEEGYITCHDTLTYVDTGLPGAVCRGFEQHPLGVRSLALRLAKATGRLTLVHADGRLEDVDYRTLPPYREPSDD